MRKHRPFDEVTDRPHPRKVRAVFCINFNKTSFVELKTDDWRIQGCCERNAADRNDQAVNPHFTVFSVLIFILDNDTVTVIFDAVDVNAEFHIDALLLKGLQGFSAHCRICKRQKRRHGFKNSDIGTEAFPDTAEFEADHAGADNA